MITPIKAFDVKLFPDETYNLIYSPQDKLHTVYVLTSVMGMKRKISAKIHLGRYLKEKYRDLSYGNQKGEIFYEEEEVSIYFDDFVIGTLKLVPIRKGDAFDRLTTLMFFAPTLTSPLNHVDVSDLLFAYIYSVEELMNKLNFVVEPSSKGESKNLTGVAATQQNFYFPWEMLDDASDVEREVVRLWCATDFPASDIANKKFLSEGYVNNMISRLRKKYPYAKIPKGARGRTQYRENLLLYHQNKQIN